MKQKLVFLVVLSLLLISVVNAEIFINEQPRESYNYGDTLEFVVGTDGEAGWLGVDMICTNKTKSVYFQYLGSTQTTTKISVPLSKAFLRDLGGNCYLDLEFNDIIKSSLGFEISNSINSELTFNKLEFDPNETIYFSGTTEKLAGGSVEGFAQVTLVNADIEVVVPVESDYFSGNISLPENIAGGDYRINVFVYEKDSLGEVSNFGVNNNSFIRVLQKPGTLQLNVPSIIDPDNDLEFSATLTDQAGNTIDDVPVSFVLKDLDGKAVLNTLSTTGTVESYKLRKNAPWGYWNISAESEGLFSETKSVYVNHNREASFNIINGTLIIKNVGNVHYDRLLEITIDNHTEVKNVNLSLGKSLEFVLSAPNGNYSVNVTDGKLDLSAVSFLTGEVIAVEGNKRGAIGFFNKHAFAWIFIIGVVGIFAFASSRKILKKNNILSAKDFSKILKKKDKGGVVKVSPSGSANHSPEVHGEKQTASFLSLKIKNQGEINESESNAKEIVDKIVHKITEDHGKVYRSGDYVIGIFAPAVTKTFNNNLKSIKTAETISAMMKEHNTKYKQKIDFGIGVGEGEIIAKKENSNFLFTPIGNTLSNIKRISDIADKTLLLSNETNSKVSSKVKTMPNKEKLGIKTYSVAEQTPETKDHSKFINKFLERNSEYKKLGDY